MPTPTFDGSAAMKIGTIIELGMITYLNWLLVCMQVGIS